MTVTSAGPTDMVAFGMLVGAVDPVDVDVDIVPDMPAVESPPEADPDAAKPETVSEEFAEVLPEPASPTPEDPKLTLNVGEKEEEALWTMTNP